MLTKYLNRKGYIIADGLTSARLLISICLAVLAWQGRPVLDIFIILIFTAWLTDCLDGFFARKSHREGHLANFDFWIDWGIYLITLLYGTILGHYSKLFTAGFVLINILAFLLSRSIYVNQAFSFLYILLGFRTIWIESQFWRNFFMLWTAGVIFFDWKRFTTLARAFLKGWGILLTRTKN